MRKNEKKTVFISHATKDKEIIDAFIDIILHGALNISIEEIFCTSTDGTKIKSGTDWRNSIRDALISAKINLLIITPNYKESEICMNEMGAAWVTSAKVIPLIVEPINYKTVGVIQEPNQIEKLLDEGSLDRIRDTIQEELDIPSKQIKSDRWSSKKQEFIIRTQRYLSKNIFDIPMNRNSFNDLQEEKINLKNTISDLIEEKIELQELVKELKNLKDKTEVSAIIKKRKKSSQFEEFEDLCATVTKILSPNSSIINGIIFKSYSGKSIDINWRGNEEVLNEALANDYIDEDLNVKWYDTKEMQNINNALSKLDTFLNKNYPDEFYETYEENYHAPLDLKNKKFWEEVFDTSIRLS